LKRSFVPLIASLIALLPATAPGLAVAQATPYTIDVVLPLTGPGAFLGQTEQKTLKVVEGVVNKQGGIRGRQLQFAYFDDQTSPQTAVALSTQILAQKPAVVLGSGIAAMCSAMDPLFSNARTLRWCLSPTFYPTVGGFVYATSVGSKDLMTGQVRYMREHGMKHIALLSTTDASGRTGEADLQDVLKLPENRSVALVAGEHYAPGDISVTAQLSKIKAAAPDAVILWNGGTALGTALHGIHDLGMEDVPMFTSSANMIYSSMKQYASVMPKALYFQGYAYTADQARNAAALRKVRAFQDAIKGTDLYPDAIAGIAWDPAMTVVDALRAVGPNATSEQLRSWVASQKSYVGIAGIYDFTNDMHGLTVDDMVVVRWNPAKQGWVKVSKFGGMPQ
jgi:branched-chain amino acid transport system substrate-binding protein